ncbi:hypothetical protein ALT785_240129 [Alteromonas infernus]
MHICSGSVLPVIFGYIFATRVAAFLFTLKGEACLNMSAAN